MSKHSKEHKLKAIHHYLSTKNGFRTTAELFGVSRTNLRHWVALYKAHGDSGLAACHTRYTQSFKLSVLRHMDDHQLSVYEAAVHFNLPTVGSLREWQKIYNKGGITALQAKPRGRPPMSKPNPLKPYTPTNKPVTQMTPDELMQELEYRRLETDYLKKLEALAQKKNLASKNKSK